MSSNLRIACVQASPTWHRPEVNREMFARAIGNVGADTDLIVLPEMFSTGFTMGSHEVAETMTGETLRWLREQAAASGATITGSLVIRDGGYFNRLVWMPPQGDESFYDKRHLFRMAGEHEHYSAGVERMLMRIGRWRVLACVCYDLRFPVWLRSRNDYDILLCVANWPAARQQAWNTLLRARAIENQCYAVGVNRVGTDGNDVEYRGGSAVYDYEGNTIAEASDEETVLTANIGLDALRGFRQQFPAWRDADEFEVAP